MSRHATARAALDFVRLIATMTKSDEQQPDTPPAPGATLDELIQTARALALAEHAAIDPHCTCPDCVRFHFEVTTKTT